jgi:integrase
MVSTHSQVRITAFREVHLPKVRFLTPPEVTALTTACAPDFQTIVKAALLTGCRYGELTALRVSAFNSDSKSIFIEKSKNGTARHVALNNEGVAILGFRLEPLARFYLVIRGKVHQQNPE